MKHGSSIKLFLPQIDRQIKGAIKSIYTTYIVLVKVKNKYALLLVCSTELVH